MSKSKTPRLASSVTEPSRRKHCDFCVLHVYFIYSVISSGLAYDISYALNVQNDDKNDISLWLSDFLRF